MELTLSNAWLWRRGGGGRKKRLRQAITLGGVDEGERLAGIDGGRREGCGRTHLRAGGSDKIRWSGTGLLYVGKEPLLQLLSVGRGNMRGPALAVGVRLPYGSRGHRLIVFAKSGFGLGLRFGGIGKCVNAWGVGFRLREDLPIRESRGRPGAGGMAETATAAASSGGITPLSGASGAAGGHFVE
jgi:hypothetical protein